MASVEAPSIEVAVACATPERQCVVELQVPAGTSAAEAVRRSAILAAFPAIDLAQAKLGIFGRRVPHEHIVAAGDRVEIYRPLTADPKTVRRERAKTARHRS